MIDGFYVSLSASPLRNSLHCRSSLAHIDAESVEIGASRAARSTPMNMPLHPNTSAATRPLVPVLIESGSCSMLNFNRTISNVQAI